MELLSRGEDAALLDLSVIEEPNRASAWSHAVPSLFPGLTVSRIEDCADAGDIRRVTMEGGELWSVHSPSAMVSYSPSGGIKAPQRSFSAMLQRSGHSVVRQQRRTCALGPGDLCLLDEQFPFAIEGEEAGDIIFMRMPRRAVIARNPHLENHTAVTLTGREPGAGLLGQMLASASVAAPFMGGLQRRAILLATIELLGAIELRGAEPASAVWWRVQAALSFIELNYAVHGLTADDVAQSQRISRRRLDQLLSETIGLSITGQIWKRRLDGAAADLSNLARADATASQIAFANGFEDAAHFTRAFKRRYGAAPLQWRAQHQGRLS